MYIMKHFIIPLFLFGCMVARLLLAYIGYIITKKHIRYLPMFGILGLLIGFGFGYNILVGRNKGAFKQRVWWQNNRYVHSLLFILFGVFALNKNKHAYKLLFIDAVLGLIFFINKHFLHL